MHERNDVAKLTMSLTDMASVAVARGFASRTEDEALEAFTASGRIAGAAGNRWMHGSAHRSKRTPGFPRRARGRVYRSGRHGRSLDRAGDWSQQWHTLSRCAIALDRIGEAELAIELFGAIERHAMLGVAPMSTTLRDLAFDTRARLEDSFRPSEPVNCWPSAPPVRWRTSYCGPDVRSAERVDFGLSESSGRESSDGDPKYSVTCLPSSDASIKPNPANKFERRRRKNGRPSR